MKSYCACVVGHALTQELLSMAAVAAAKASASVAFTASMEYKAFTVRASIVLRRSSALGVDWMGRKMIRGAQYVMRVGSNGTCCATNRPLQIHQGAVSAGCAWTVS